MTATTHQIKNKKEPDKIIDLSERLDASQKTELIKGEFNEEYWLIQLKSRIEQIKNKDQNEPDRIRQINERLDAYQNTDFIKNAFNDQNWQTRLKAYQNYGFIRVRLYYNN